PNGGRSQCPPGCGLKPGLSARRVSDAAGARELRPPPQRSPAGCTTRTAWRGASMSVEFLHTMIRAGDLDAAVRFFCGGLGLTEVRRNDYPQGRYTLVFLASPDDIRRAD